VIDLEDRNSSQFFRGRTRDQIRYKDRMAVIAPLSSLTLEVRN